MQFNRSQFKTNAIGIIRESKPNVILITLLYVGVLMVLQYLSSSLLTGNITDSAAQRYMNMVQSGNVEGAVAYAQTLMPSHSNVLVDLLIRVAEWILSAGFIIFIMNTVRHTGEACAGNLLDGFGIFFRVFALHIIMLFVVGALSCLFVFPGIIAAYSYRQSIYLLIEHPEMGVFDCMKESRKMMNGHKMELFKLDLSFFGWLLLLFFVTPAAIWVTPYTDTTWMLYYDYLKSLQPGAANFTGNT